MTKAIPRSEWKGFCDDISKCRFEWRTRVELLNDSFGNQILSYGLPLNGLTFEECDSATTVEVSLGHDPEHHQSHVIRDPEEIFYLSKEGETGSVVEIKDKGGTETLIHIMRPMPLVWDYV